jgi:hypothetical protein
MAKEKGKQDKHTSAKEYTENERSMITNSTKTWGEIRSLEGETVPAPLVVPVMLL